MDSGTGVAELCRTMGVSEATFYNWRKKYAGMGVTEVRELADERRTSYELSARRACGLLELGRSSFFYRPKPPDDQTLRLRIWELSATRGRFRYRRIRVLLPPGRMDGES